MTHLKEAHISKHATPPYYLKVSAVAKSFQGHVNMQLHFHLPHLFQADLRNLNLSVETFGTKFDVILVDPP